MNKKCAKCSKTVYPTEELKCLDKVWHKFCFKCEVCGMTLNMKNYKGYEKLPYCNAHYPSTRPTQVADTPETRRIAENTKIQSNVQYHAEFERQKGTKTSVADDPETARIRQNTQNQSNVNYWGVREQREQMEHKRPNEMMDDVTRRSRNPGKISDYDPRTEESDFASPYSQRNSANVVYDSQRGEGGGGESRGQRASQHGGFQQPFSYGGGGPPPSHLHGNNPTRSSYHDDGQSRGGQRSSYGEAQQAPYGGGSRDSYGSNSRDSYSGSRDSYGGSRDSYNGSRDSYGGAPNRDSYGGAPNRDSYGGSMDSYGGSRERYGAGPDRQSGSYGQQQGFSYTGAPVAMAGQGGAPRSSYHDPTPQAQAVPQQVRTSHPPAPKQPSFKAIYDYTAADDDEVSFCEGDIIVNTNIIDQGWMVGTVSRTGQHGMLPSNYVERI